MHCCKSRGAWRASTLSSAPERFSASPWLKRQLQRHWASHLCNDQVAAFSLLLRLLPLLEELPARHKESRVPFATLKVDKTFRRSRTCLGVRALSIKFRLHLVELLLVGELLGDELGLHHSGGFFGRSLLLGGIRFSEEPRAGGGVANGGMGGILGD